MADWASSLVNTAAFLLCTSFLAYVVLIVLPYLRHRPGAPGKSEDYALAFIIPCLNEAEVIEGTLRSLVVSQPLADVWCVDDASDDATPVVLARLAAEFPQIHVVTRTLPEARMGKGRALNAGYEALRAEFPAHARWDRVLVGVLDADSRLDPRCPAAITGPEFFGDDTVGAVQVEVRVRPSLDGGPSRRVQSGRLGRLLVQLQDLEFSGPIAAMQLLRRRTGSVGMGGNGQFTRLSVLNEVAVRQGTPWGDALLEDFELGLQVLFTGSRNEYCHSTFVAQEGITRPGMLVRQRSRWAQGAMQCMSYLWDVMTCRAIATPGAIEVFYFLLLPWLQIAGGVLYGASTGLMLYYLFTTPGGVGSWLAGGAWGVVPLFIIFGVAPFGVWGFIYRRAVDPSITRRRAALLGAANLVYVYLHQVAVWWALVRVVFRHDDWKKTPRVAADYIPSFQASAAVSL